MASFSPSRSIPPSDSDNPALAEERPYHPKRPHKKSRAGCKSCKARKVKCDEARPTCKACRLRRTECFYTSSPPTAPSTNATTTKPTSSPISKGETRDLPIAASFQPPIWSTATDPSVESSPRLTPDATAFDDEDAASSSSSAESIIVSEPMFRPMVANDEIDMRLLWFYTTTTASSFTVQCGYNRATETVMRTRVVQHAFRAPFLMHSLFALSALHLQHLDQEIDPKRTLGYRQAAFAGYREAIEKGDPNDYGALIANSLVLTALSSQQFLEPDCKDLYIIDWMVVWRGIGLLIDKVGRKGLTETGVHPLFCRPPLDLEAAPYAIPNNLLYMVSAIDLDDEDYPDTQTYYDTLKYLGALYDSLRQGLNPIMNLRIITWFTFLPAKFINLGRQYRPRALIIIAYYAIFLKMAYGIWWNKGIGQRTLRDICKHLGPEWSNYLKIPMLAMGIEGSTELARLVLDDPEWLSPAWPNSEDMQLSVTLKDFAWVNQQGKICDLDTGLDDSQSEVDARTSPLSLL